MYVLFIWSQAKLTFILIKYVRLVHYKLSSVFVKIPRHDWKLLLSDLNAQVTLDCSLLSGVIVGQSLHSSSNDICFRLLNCCITHQLTIGGTLIQHKGAWRLLYGCTVNDKSNNQLVSISLEFCNLY